MLCSVVGLQCSDHRPRDRGLDSSSNCRCTHAYQWLDRIGHGDVHKSFFRIEIKMSVLYVALPVALLLGGSALLACLACIRSGQYDDLETPSIKLLNDEMKQQ